MADRQLVPMQQQQSNQIILPQPNEMETLANSIKEWRSLTEECRGLKEQISERTRRIKAYQEVIVRIMKNNNVGALDLKTTGGRVITKQRKSQSGLTPKVLQSQLATYLKSEDEAKKVLEFIQSNRTTTMRDALLYEKP